MKWVNSNNKLPIKSWCENLEGSALDQASNLANHPVIEKHIALMPDAHCGYGMPIGGVIACKDAVIPNAVGVDIGCGMVSVKSNIQNGSEIDMPTRRQIMDFMKKEVPLGEGHAHPKEQQWDGFDEFIKLLIGFSGQGSTPNWMEEKVWSLAKKNLGSLGGGNHFVEMQVDEDDCVWLMLHSGSRNLGYKIASYYNDLAKGLMEKWHSNIPTSDLAFLPAHSDEGKAYIRDMNFALDYAKESRRRMMNVFMESVEKVFPTAKFDKPINIHHNFAAIENHFGKNYWIHRKGATQAVKGKYGIIPGSMGTHSYIVEGLSNPDSFSSCSHGAGRRMSRTDAILTLSEEDATKSMDGIVCDRWKPADTGHGKKRRAKFAGKKDISESPGAYKDIEDVIQAELDLIKPVVKLKPIAVIKG